PSASVSFHLAGTTMKRLKSSSKIAIVAALGAGLWAGCSPAPSPGGGDGDGDGGGDGDVVGDGDLMPGDGDLMPGDGDGLGGGGVAWPATPNKAPDAPVNVEELFAGASTGAGCVTEPADGSLIPRNWL